MTIAVLPKYVLLRCDQFPFSETFNIGRYPAGLDVERDAEFPGETLIEDHRFGVQLLHECLDDLLYFALSFGSAHFLNFLIFQNASVESL